MVHEEDDDWVDKMGCGEGQEVDLYMNYFGGKA